MVTYAKNSPKSGEPQRYSWGTQKKKKKKIIIRSFVITSSSAYLVIHHITISCTTFIIIIITIIQHSLLCYHQLTCLPCDTSYHHFLQTHHHYHHHLLSHDTSLAVFNMSCETVIIIINFIYPMKQHSTGLATPSSSKSTLRWLVGCLTSQQHASVSQGQICSDSFTCCHTEIEVADQTFYLTQTQYTDTRPTL